MEKVRASRLAGSIVSSIRKIANSNYFAVSLDQQDDWIMRPAMGRQGAAAAGISPNGTAWFFNGETGFVFYDAARRELVDRLRTPLARGFDDAQTPGAGHCALVEAEAGRFACLLLYHRRSTDLHVIDVERREIIRSALELPNAYWLCRACSLIRVGGFCSGNPARRCDRYGPASYRSADRKLGNFRLRRTPLTCVACQLEPLRPLLVARR